MNAVITLLGSIVIAIFFIGPSFAARLAIESFIVKQPSRSQSSTEELARSLFFSIPLVALASLLVWIVFRGRYTFDLNAAGALFAEHTGAEERIASARRLWPISYILITTYLLDGIYFGLVYAAVWLLPRLEDPSSFSRLYPVCDWLAAPYLKSDWDMLVTGVGLEPNTVVHADVATKSGKIYMGRLANAKTTSDGTLIHLQLEQPVIRGNSSATPPVPPYIFRSSEFFLIPATEIANVNLRFATLGESVPTMDEAAGVPRTSRSAAQAIPEQSLEDALKSLDEDTKFALSQELDEHDRTPPVA